MSKERENRIIHGYQAVQEALDISMFENERTVLIGQGVPDASQTYGTTSGLLEKYGKDRVLELPVSEASGVGIMLGASLLGMRPVATFARLEFALLAMDQIVNQAAKWCYMFNGSSHVPITLRLIVGRGWGQGAQHSQSLHSMFAHVPGLKVVMPSTPYDLKGLLIASIRDPNPVIFIEHRWLHYNFGVVPQEKYSIEIGKPHLISSGKDATVVASSYMIIEAMKALKNLEREDITTDLIDLRTISPLDDTLILKSVEKTGRLIVCDQGTCTAGFSAEIISRVSERSLKFLKSPPIRITLPDCPTPTTRGLSNYYYPTHQHIENAIRKSLELKELVVNISQEDFLDVPDDSFKGPF